MFKLSIELKLSYKQLRKLFVVALLLMLFLG